MSKLAQAADVSLARAGFTSDCEAALNEQIKSEKVVVLSLDFFFEPVVVVRGRGRDRGSPVSPRAVPLLWLWWWRWRLVSTVDPDAVSTARRGRLFFCFEERQKEGK